MGFIFKAIWQKAIIILLHDLIYMIISLAYSTPMAHNISMKIPHTIAETSSYSNAISKLWSIDEQEAFKLYIALNPSAGDVIQDTNGMRKIRWAGSGKGKRGGTRVIYYYYNESAPLYLLYAYPKGTQENLTPEEKKVFRSFTKAIKQNLKEGGNKNV